MNTNYSKDSDHVLAPEIVLPSSSNRRRKLAYNTLAIVAAGGLGFASAAIFKEVLPDDLGSVESLTCTSGDAFHQLQTGDTVWEDVAEPLADKLDITTDAAMTQIDLVNPDIDVYGSLPTGTNISIPDCE